MATGQVDVYSIYYRSMFCNFVQFNVFPHVYWQLVVCQVEVTTLLGKTLDHIAHFKFLIVRIWLSSYKIVKWEFALKICNWGVAAGVSKWREAAQPAPRTDSPATTIVWLHPPPPFHVPLRFKCKYSDLGEITSWLKFLERRPGTSWRMQCTLWN